jgi:hypothetical protein
MPMISTSHSLKQNFSDALLNTLKLVLMADKIKLTILSLHAFGVIEKGMQESWHLALRNIDNLYKID